MDVTLKANPIITFVLDFITRPPLYKYHQTDKYLTPPSVDKGKQISLKILANFSFDFYLID
jgi:hypothetical protein